MRNYGMNALCPKCKISMEVCGTGKSIAFCKNCANIWAREDAIPDEQINPSRRE